MKNRSEAFGRLLKAGIGSVAMCEGKRAPIIEDELGQQIGVSADSIQRYKSGYLPPEHRTIKLLAEACVRRGFLGREWLQRFLYAAHYPAPDQLLDELCPTGPARPRPKRVYHNLPAPTYSQFVMRPQAFAEIVDGLQQRSAAVVIVGLGGNGKTSLAREVAHSCLQENTSIARFDAAVWVSDKDNQGTTNLSTVLDTIARTLDYPGFTQFAHEEKHYEVEQLLRRQRVLLVVDNFETITDGALLSWVLRLPEPSKAMLTTREYRREYRRGGWPVELRGMTDSEARKLINERLRVLKIERLVTDETQLEPLMVATGGNPKAITMTLGLLKYERRPLQQVVDDIYAARGELFDDLFTRAWALLDEAAQRVLLVTTFFVDSASEEALATTADVQGYAFARTVERLTDMALLDVEQTDVHSAPRYGLHTLVQAFARARLAERPEFEAGARERWARYFVNFTLACNADGWDWPHQFHRVDLDIANVQAVMQYCYDNSHWNSLIKMVLSVKTFWNTRGYFETRNKFVALALDATRILGNVPAQVKLLTIKIRTLCYLGNVQTAQRCYEQASALLSTLDNPAPGLIEDVNDAQIRVCVRFGHFEQQLLLAEANVASAKKRNSFGGQVLYSYNIADYLLNVARYDEAEKLFLHLIEVSQGRYQRALITGWSSLARIALHKRQLELAEQCLGQALTLAHELKHRRHLAEAKRLKAQLYSLCGHIPAAHAALTEAIDLFERMGMRHELAEARQELAQLMDREPAIHE